MRTFVEASFVERPDEASLQQSRQNDHKTSREDKHHAAAASAVARSNVKRTPPGRAPAIRRIRSGMSSCQIQMHLSRVSYAYDILAFFENLYNTTFEPF